MHLSDSTKLDALFVTLDPGARSRYLFEVIKGENEALFTRLFPLGYSEFKNAINTVISLIGRRGETLSFDETEEIARLIMGSARMMIKESPFDAVYRYGMTHYPTLMKSAETFMLIYLYIERLIHNPNFHAVSKRRRAYFISEAEREIGGSLRAHGINTFTLDESASIFRGEFESDLSFESYAEAFWNSKNEILGPRVAPFLKSLSSLESLLRFLLFNFGLNADDTPYEVMGSLLLLFRETAERTSLSSHPLTLSRLYRKMVGKYAYSLLFMVDELALVHFYFDLMSLNDEVVFTGEEDYRRLSALFLSYRSNRTEWPR